MSDNFLVSIWNNFNFWLIDWYPRGWTSTAGAIILAILCILFLLALIFLPKKLQFPDDKRWIKYSIVAIIIGSFIWTIPALLNIIIRLFFEIVCIALLIIGVIALFGALFSKVTEDSEQTSEDGEYYIKAKNGKENVYKKSILGDEDKGELKNKWDGSKETRNIFGPNSKVDGKGIFDEGRKGEVDGTKGVFKKDLFDDHDTFHPDK